MNEKSVKNVQCTSQPGPPLEGSAVKRLLHDYKDLLNEPVKNAAAEPLNENNMLVWHGNIAAPEGPYQGYPFHLELTFSASYPAAPPSVKLFSSTLSHPNVFHYSFSPYICLDLLKEHTSTIPYAGWSSSYSVSSILMQLQSFLFDVAVPQEYGGNRQNVTDVLTCQRTIEEIKGFKCTTLGCFHHHVPGIEWPKINIDEKKNTKLTTIATNNKNDMNKNTGLSQLIPPICCIIFDYLSSQDVVSLSNICPYSREIIEKHPLMAQREWICFHTKASITQSDTVLGFGLTPTYHTHRAALAKTVLCLDTLSYDAFWNQKVRLGVWKETFTHFLPLYICTSHGQRAQPILDQCMYHLIRKIPGDSPPVNLDTYYEKNKATILPVIFHILANVMNQMVVQLMYNLGPTTTGHFNPQHQIRQMFHSENALSGYCAIHHLLLSYIIRFPSMVTYSNEKIKEFLAGACDKTSVPDLGEWLIHLLVTNKYTWNDVYTDVLRESMDRNARWILQTSPELGGVSHRDTYSNANLCYRLTKSWETAMTGSRLMLFQSFFIEMVTQNGGVSHAKLFAQYNSRMGRPPPQFLSVLQKTSKQFLDVKNYVEYFKTMGSVNVTAHMIMDSLLQSIRNSRHKGYHRHENSYCNLSEQKCLCSGAKKCRFFSTVAMSSPDQKKLFQNSKVDLKQKEKSTNDVVTITRLLTTTAITTAPPPSSDVKIKPPQKTVVNFVAQLANELDRKFVPTTEDRQMWGTRPVPLPNHLYPALSQENVPIRKREDRYERHNLMDDVKTKTFEPQPPPPAATPIKPKKLNPWKVLPSPTQNQTDDSTTKKRKRLIVKVDEETQKHYRSKRTIIKQMSGWNDVVQKK